MSDNDDKPFKTNVEAAVAHLIGKGIIKKDADVVQDLKMSKGTFSAYKSGKTEPSKNFVQQFEKQYKLKLDDFDPIKIAAGKNFSTELSIEEKYVALLERQVTSNETLNQLTAIVNDVQQTQLALFAKLAAGQEVTMECFADLLKRPGKDLLKRIQGKMNEQLKTFSVEGIASAQDS